MADLKAELQCETDPDRRRQLIRRLDHHQGLLEGKDMQWNGDASTGKVTRGEPVGSTG
ncbi:hypothetical protein [Lentisalinibacter salinarum]|uniref:hypothetical protein n=1 Tax=Lentisalinibacter salinarum TaxID=2992239 RepID=UPI00386A6B91